MEEVIIFFVCRGESISLATYYVLDKFSHKLRKSEFNEVRSFLPILPMAITDTKIVSEVAAIEVRTQNKGVLVDLVGVVRNESHSGCECVFSDYVSLN